MTVTIKQKIVNADYIRIGVVLLFLCAEKLHQNNNAFSSAGVDTVIKMGLLLCLSLLPFFETEEASGKTIAHNNFFSKEKEHHIKKDAARYPFLHSCLIKILLIAGI